MKCVSYQEVAFVIPRVHRLFLNLERVNEIKNMNEREYTNPTHMHIFKTNLFHSVVGLFRFVNYLQMYSAMHLFISLRN